MFSFLIFLPRHFCRGILHHSFVPKHIEFEEPTRWSLLNAFTETVKKYTPQRVDLSYTALTRCFGLDGKQPQLWS